MRVGEKKMNEANQLTPHPHAALIREWSDHVASGAVAAGWYELEYTRDEGGWYGINHPNWIVTIEYRIAMKPKHPAYKPPLKKIVIELELTDKELKEFNAFFDGDFKDPELKKLDAAFNKAIKESK
jgi:hypothetical protein